MSEATIDHVSDTALWVAYYRAKESSRTDALFKDHLAQALIGARGQKIAEGMKVLGRYTEWSVISRTVIIDKFILDLVNNGVDMVLNLGAGLDTRPYRMNLPAELKWVEVDYAHIIDHKNNVLKSEKPKCQLTRVSLDLADIEKRRNFLSEINSQAKKILVLTEGVILYLDEEQVSSLSQDLQTQSNMYYWITEYFNPRVYRYLKAGARTRQMEKSPFKFYPSDWIGFFQQRGWTVETIKYSSEIALQYGRKLPQPWWAKIFQFFMSKEALAKSQKMAGYMTFSKNKIGC